MVVKGKDKAETERWYQALKTHVESNKMGRLMPTYVVPIARDPKFFKDVIIIDLGSSSIRAGILSAHQATLPQIFFPSVAAVDKNTGQMIAFGTQAVMPDVRAHSTLIHPLRASSKISKVKKFPFFTTHFLPFLFSPTVLTLITFHLCQAVHVGHGWRDWINSNSHPTAQCRPFIVRNSGTSKLIYNPLAAQFTNNNVSSR